MKIIKHITKLFLKIEAALSHILMCFSDARKSLSSLFRAFESAALSGARTPADVIKMAKKKHAMMVMTLFILEDDLFQKPEAMQLTSFILLRFHVYS